MYQFPPGSGTATTAHFVSQSLAKLATPKAFLPCPKGLKPPNLFVEKARADSVLNLLNLFMGIPFSITAFVLLPSQKEYLEAQSR
ncbi:hypothetical protein [Scytonema sp. PCC 10023]|uniref:hypothetical protein n=1 Tax=Scytonema sp. PCC 10023 TaxID=1680591 RepID=UPI0039C646CD